MKKRYSHLIWLGAGTAAEPMDLLNDAEQIVLLETRESACHALRKEYSNSRIRIEQQLITPDGAIIEFTEYNLPAFSAIRPASGLKALFPGLKPVHTEKLQSESIVNFINRMEIKGHNNLLIIDIVDMALEILNSMINSGHLNQFDHIRLQSSPEPLYVEAATQHKITSLLEQQGYTLQQTITDDPDLPWLHFNRNPLWQELLDAKKSQSELNHAHKKIRQELIESQQKNKQLENEAKAQKQQLDEIVNELRIQLNVKTEENKNLAAEYKAAQMTVVSQKEALNEELSIAKVKISELIEQKDQSQTQTKNYENTIEELKTQLNKSRLDNESSGKKLKDLTHENEVLRNEKLALTKEISAVSTQVADLSKQKEQLITENAEIQKKLREINRILDQLKNENQRITSEQATKFDQLLTSEKEQQAALVKLQSELEVINKQSTKRQERIQILEKENRTLQEENLLLSKRQIALELEFAKAEAQVSLVKDLLLR